MPSILFICSFFSFFYFIIGIYLCFFFFFFNDTATTEIYTLSLHDALPIYLSRSLKDHQKTSCHHEIFDRSSRSEEHTSELQSPCNLVCRLLLEKKKKKSWEFIQYSQVTVVPQLSPIRRRRYESPDRHCRIT